MHFCEGKVELFPLGENVFMKKSAVTALTMVIAFAGFCLLICLTELFFHVILVLSYWLVSLVPY
jgi:hypothetical protein